MVYNKDLPSRIEACILEHQIVSWIHVRHAQPDRASEAENEIDYLNGRYFTIRGRGYRHKYQEFSNKDFATVSSS